MEVLQYFQYIVCCGNPTKVYIDRSFCIRLKYVRNHNPLATILYGLGIAPHHPGASTPCAGHGPVTAERYNTGTVRR